MLALKVILTRKALLCAIALAPCLSSTPASAQEAILTPILLTAPNFRDLAGISEIYGGTGFVDTTSNGGVMRTGIFYRTDALNSLDTADRNTLSALHIDRDIDLRTPNEIYGTPGPPPIAAAQDVVPAGVTWTNINIYGTPGPIPSPFDGTLANAISFMQTGYQAFVTDPVQQNGFRRVLLTLAHDSGPDLWHCSGGKDRTGWTSALLQSIAGVPEATIMQDYLATNSYTASLMSIAKAYMLLENPGWSPATIDALLGVEPSYLQAGLDQVATTYGSMLAYLTQGLGLTQADLYVLRAKMVYYSVLPGQNGLAGNAASGAALLNALQNSPLSGHYTEYNYYLQSAIDQGTLGGVETRVGGQVLADAAAYLLHQSQLIDDALTPLSSGQNLKFGQTDAWLSGVAGYQEVSSRSGIASSDDRSSGLIVGGTHRFNDNVSAYLGTSFISNKVESAGANADIDNYLVIFGGRYALSKLETGPYLGVRFSAGSLDYSNTRPLDYGLGNASGETDGKTYSGRIDFGDIFDAGTFTVTPQVGVLVAHIDLDRFNEQGSELALNINSISQTTPSLLAELRVDLNERQLGSWMLKPSAMVGYEHALDTSKATSTGSLYGYSVSQESAYDSQNLAKLGFGITARHSALSLQLGVNAMVGENIKLPVLISILHITFSRLHQGPVHELTFSNFCETFCYLPLTSPGFLIFPGFTMRQVPSFIESRIPLFT